MEIDARLSLVNINSTSQSTVQQIILLIWIYQGQMGEVLEQIKKDEDLKIIPVVCIYDILSSLKTLVRYEVWS